ncbi:hypothetical protein VNO77_42822 [Canavalia gladiata]|uniref:Uncharacterized protein n=1 Tax=Canavalia gladiata TaxID=3824 RepID=A0AAN9JTP4_CANGL
MSKPFHSPRNPPKPSLNPELPHSNASNSSHALKFKTSTMIIELQFAELQQLRSRRRRCHAGSFTMLHSKSSGKLRRRSAPEEASRSGGSSNEGNTPRIPEIKGSLSLGKCGGEEN